MSQNIQYCNISDLYGKKVLAVALTELLLRLQFIEYGDVDIEDYWELLDPLGNIIDRAIGSKFRKSARIKELVGSVLVEYIMEEWFLNLIFENKNKLRVKRSKPIEEDHEAIHSVIRTQGGHLI